jgi:hypothetical protein
MSTPELVIAHRNQTATAARGIGPIKAVPDTELVDVMVRLGMPKFRAVEIHWNPEKRLEALTIWSLEQDARDGDREARQALDLARAMLVRQRQEELVCDDPRRGHDEVFDPRELL